jgi:AcrR family transcriptional regulator
MATDSDVDLHDAILEAALRGVTEYGYADLSMRKIARRVGCSPGTIYLYYANKNAIYAALIDKAVLHLIESYQPAFSIEDPVERLDAFCRCYVRFALTYPELYKVMYLELGLDPREVSPEGYRRAWKPLHDTAQALEEAHAQGALRVPSPMEGATLVWAALHGMLSLILARQVNPKADHERLIDMMIAHIIAGFRPS